MKNIFSVLCITRTYKKLFASKITPLFWISLFFASIHAQNHYYYLGVDTNGCQPTNRECRGDATEKSHKKTQLTSRFYATRGWVQF